MTSECINLKYVHIHACVCIFGLRIPVINLSCRRPTPLHLDECAECFSIRGEISPNIAGGRFLPPQRKTHRPAPPPQDSRNNCVHHGIGICAFCRWLQLLAIIACVARTVGGIGTTQSIHIPFILRGCNRHTKVFASSLGVALR